MATSIPKENEHSANIASMFSSFQNFMNAEQQKREVCMMMLQESQGRPFY